MASADGTALGAGSWTLGSSGVCSTCCTKMGTAAQTAAQPVFNDSIPLLGDGRWEVLPGLVEVSRGVPRNLSRAWILLTVFSVVVFSQGLSQAGTSRAGIVFSSRFVQGTDGAIKKRLGK